MSLNIGPGKNLPKVLCIFLQCPQKRQNVALDEAKTALWNIFFQFSIDLFL